MHIYFMTQRRGREVGNLEEERLQMSNEPCVLLRPLASHKVLGNVCGKMIIFCNTLAILPLAAFLFAKQ